jgi:aminopeptidase
MRDGRNEVLVRNLLHYSVALQPGETIMIEVAGKDTLELAKELIRQATRLGAVAFWYYSDPSLERLWIQGATEAQFKAWAKVHLKLMKECDAYIYVNGCDNPFDPSDLPDEQVQLYDTLFIKPVHLEERLKNTKWCALRFPSNSMAQLAEMSQEAFEDFYYDVCCLDYAQMSKAMDPLVELMEKTDMVRIVAPGTDLTFSIKGIPVVKCDGKENIPDGEVFTAPVKDSINGHITFNTPMLERGFLFRDIRFEFRDGRVVEASCQAGADKLNEILDTDEGARYVGEFALGLNPFILHPIKDALFDEKIAGSLHIAVGTCGEEASNGNQSAIHWDLVQIQRQGYGGGEIYFDGELIRKDGVFVDEELEESFSAEALRGG